MDSLDHTGAEPSSVAQSSHLKVALEGREYDLALEPNDAVVFFIEVRRIRR